MARRLVLVSVLLFATGACALVYQSVWLRSFRLIFGSSTPSTAAVLAVWMGGLGLGAVWLGRRAQRTANPLRMYAQLELGIALTAAISPFLVFVARSAYLGVGGSSVLGAAGATALRLALTPLVLGAPAVMLGGTLPAVSRVVTDSEDAGRKSLALLYGVNTMGAVAGVLLSTFVLFEGWGMQRTLWVTCLFNCAVALVAWGLSNSKSMLPAPQTTRREVPPAPSVPEGPTVARPWLLSAAFATGFCFLLQELVWYRMAGPILGGSTYTFALVLAVALIGISLGGLIYAWRGPAEATAGLLAVTCALEAVAILAPFWLGDDLALCAEMLRDHATTFAARCLGWAAVTVVLVFPASLVAGFQFPLLIALRGRGRANVATDVGEVYGVNTAGAIAGSLAGGFGLLPLLSAPGAWLCSALVLLLVGAYFALRSRRRQPSHALVFCLLGGSCAIGAFAAGPGPVWRHAQIGAGRSTFAAAKTANGMTEKKLRAARFLLEEVDGRESSLGIGIRDSLALVVNGKVDGSALGDAKTQILVGLVGAVLHPNPRRAFVVGLGTGQTAGWLAEVPSIDRVDVAEIEPDVIAFARLCGPTNHDVVQHPKVQILTGDGREALQTARDHFDLIVSEPSNPYRAGVASLYSADFYRQAKSRLAPGGMFLQWIQAYDVDGETLLIALATLRSVFHHVTVWRLTAPTDLFFLATNEAQVIDLERVGRRLPVEPYRTGLGRVAGIHEPEGLLALNVANHRLADATLAMLRMRGAPLSTDDQSVLEYRFARSVGRSIEILPADLAQVAAQTAAQTPMVKGSFDWARHDLLRARIFQASEAAIPGFRTTQPQRLALWRAIAKGDLARARQLVVGVSPPPAHDLFERLLLIELPVGVPGPKEGRALVLEELAELERQGYGSDAACLRLMAGLADGANETTPHLSKAAIGLARADPWLSRPLLQRTLTMLQIRTTDPAVAREVAEELLRGPFAVYSMEFLRRATALRLALVSQDDALITRAFNTYEPFPLWERKLLALRARAYERTGSPLAERAREDLGLFEHHAVIRLSEVLAPIAPHQR